MRRASFWVWSSVVSCLPEAAVLLTGAAWTGTGCRVGRGLVSQPGVWSWGPQASQPGAGREGTPPDPSLGTLAQGTGSAGDNDWLQLLGHELRLGTGTFTFVSLLPTFWECSDLVFGSFMSSLPRRLQGLSTPESSVSSPQHSELSLNGLHLSDPPIPLIPTSSSHTRDTPDPFHTGPFCAFVSSSPPPGSLP